MQHTFVNVETPIGYIESGRDAIYLNSFEQIFNSIVMKGRINSRFCSNEYQNFKWYDYELKLKDVKAYKCEYIDIYAWKEWQTNSAISQVIDSEWHKQYKINGAEYKHILVETYDYIYFVLCKEIEIYISGQRK